MPAFADAADHWMWLAAAIGLAGYVYAYASGRAGTPIRSDAFSYYVYLPAWLLHHDPSLDAVADDCCGGEFPAWTAIVRWPSRTTGSTRIRSAKRSSSRRSSPSRTR